MRLSKNKNLNNLLINFFLSLWLVITFGVIDVHLARAKKFQENISSNPTSTPQNALHKATEPSVEELPTEKPKTTKEQIEDYIREKFGEHADKAFLLLKGNEKCGGENPNLNPKAVNINKDGSRDRGIFQINDKYHPLTDEQAFDYKTNIKYAHKIFKESGYKFSLWTAGRCLGI